MNLQENIRRILREDRETMFLDKIVNLMISQTKIDHDNEMIYFPFETPLSFFSNSKYLPKDNIMKLIRDKDFTLPGIIVLWFRKFFNYIGQELRLSEEQMEYVYKKYKRYIDDETK